MDIPGLTIDYKYRKGTGIDLVDGTTGRVSGDASESEHTFDIRYRFQDIKGLSTRLRYGIYENKDVPGETDENQVRLYLDYKF
jgi:hypothetical protein